MLAIGTLVAIWLVLPPVPSTAAAPEPASDRQLAELATILAGAEFQLAERSGALDALLDPIRTLVRAALETLRGWFRGGERLEIGGLGFVAAAIAGLIVLFAAYVVLRLGGGGMLGDAALAEAAPAGPPRAQQERARASALARAGDPRTAVHHLYQAVLRRLDERGFVPFDASLTNREHLPRVANPAVRWSLTPLVAEFDKLWYGQSSCSAEEYERFAALAERVWQATGSGAA